MPISFAHTVFASALVAFAFLAASELVTFASRCSTEQRYSRAGLFGLMAAAAVNVGMGLFVLQYTVLLGTDLPTPMMFSALATLKVLLIAFAVAVLSLMVLVLLRHVERLRMYLLAAACPVLSLYVHHQATYSMLIHPRLTYEPSEVAFALLMAGVLTWFGLSIMRSKRQGHLSHMHNLAAVLLLSLGCSVVTHFSTHALEWPQGGAMELIPERLSFREMDAVVGVIAVYLQFALLHIFFLSRRVSERSRDEANALNAKNNRIQAQMQAMTEQVASRVRQMHEHYLNAMESVEEGLWDLELANNSMYVSQAWMVNLGYDHALDIRDLDDWRALIHPEDLPEFQQKFNTHLQGESSIFEVEYRLRKQNSEWFWVGTRGKLLKDTYGMVVRVVGIHHDIDQRKLAEQALSRAFETEKRLSRLKSEFVTMLSHELRTPLTVLVSSRALLGASLDSGVITRASLNRYLGQMDQAINRLRTLVEETLTYVQIETTVTPASPAWVDLPALVRRVADETTRVPRDLLGLVTDTPQPNVEILIESTLTQPKVCVDEAGLFQVVKQLMEHSLLVSEAEREIRFGLSADDVYVFIHVLHQKNPRADTIRQFQLLDFGDASDTTNLTVDRLGLEIIKRLVDRMGGILLATMDLDRLEIEVKLPKGEHA